MTSTREPVEIVRFREEASRIQSLSCREREVSILVAEGLTNKQIGNRLCISAITVRHHLSTIFRKLEISSRFELIVLCYRHRLVVPPVMMSPNGDPVVVRAVGG